MKHYREQSHKDRNAKLHRMTGGHSDEKADRALVHKMVKSDALTGKAKGGRAHTSHARTVRPASAPMAMAPGAGQPMGQPSAGLGAMASPPLKKGGRACRAHGGRVTKHHMTAGAESGVGRLEKIGKRP